MYPINNSMTGAKNYVGLEQASRQMEPVLAEPIDVVLAELATPEEVAAYLNGRNVVATTVELSGKALEVGKYALGLIQKEQLPAGTTRTPEYLQTMMSFGFQHITTFGNCMRGIKKVKQDYPEIMKQYVTAEGKDAKTLALDLMPAGWVRKELTAYLKQKGIDADQIKLRQWFLEKYVLEDDGQVQQTSSEQTNLVAIQELDGELSQTELEMGNYILDLLRQEKTPSKDKQSQKYKQEAPRALGLTPGTFDRFIFSLRAAKAAHFDTLKKYIEAKGEMAKKATLSADWPTNLRRTLSAYSSSRDSTPDQMNLRQWVLNKWSADNRQVETASPLEDTAGRKRELEEAEEVSLILKERRIEDSSVGDKEEVVE